MKWRPIRTGVPYTCQECPAFREAIADRDHWRLVAEALYNGEETARWLYKKSVAND